MGDARTERIDNAVSAASELIGFLQDAGPVNGAQARLIVEAVVRASVAKVEDWEIRASAKRVAADLEKPVLGEGVQLGLALEGGQHGDRTAR
jgi:hypothetical protein